MFSSTIFKLSNPVLHLTNTLLQHARKLLSNCHTCHTSSRFSFPYTYGIKVPISALFPAYFGHFQKRRKSIKPHDDTCKSCHFDPILTHFGSFSIFSRSLDAIFAHMIHTYHYGLIVFRNPSVSIHSRMAFFFSVRDFEKRCLCPSKNFFQIFCHKTGFELPV